MKNSTSFFSLFYAVALMTLQFPDAATYDAEAMLETMGARAGGLGKVSVTARAQAIEALASKLRAGDALMLPRQYAMGDVDLSGIPDDIELSFGKEGTVFLGGRHENMSFRHFNAGLVLGHKPGTAAKRTAARSSLYNSEIITMNGDFAGGDVINTTVVNKDGKLSVKGKVQNSKFLYIRYHNPCATPCIDFDLGGTGQGSMMYQIVEHNYNEKNTGVLVKNAKDFVFMAGDTEGSEAPQGCWRLENCENVTIAAHRDFHSHSKRGNTGGTSYIIGGNGNRLFYAYSLGDAFPLSLVSDDPGLQIWGGWWEDKVEIHADALKVFHTPEGMIAEEFKWTEPVIVDKEVMFTYKGKDLTKAEIAKATTVPNPPILPSSKGAGAQAKISSRFSEAANWGAALIEAGADPTGTRSSSAAFKKILATQAFVQIPKGKFLLTEPLKVGSWIGTESQYIFGAGPGQTVLKVAGSFPGIQFEEQGALGKAGSTGIKGGVAALGGLAVDGGTFGMAIFSYAPGKTFENLEFTNQTKAGIKVGCEEFNKRCGGEFDQQRFINIKFTNTGDYGFHAGNGMTDKQFFYKCTFTGQKKAGISYNYTHMFAGSIIQCHFENINGPGVDFYPLEVFAGYTPHQGSIESCTFKNCGNAEQPVIDWNWFESAAIANVDITIDDGRKWKYGFRGTGQILSRVKFTAPAADMVPGGAAFAIRHTRQVKNSRPTGNILVECSANGPIAFINDTPEQEAIFNKVKIDPCPISGLGGTECGKPVRLEPSSAGFNFTGTLKWWQDADPSKVYPWAYPHLLYNSKFSNAEYPYTLLRTNVKGEILEQVGLNGTAVSIPRQVMSTPMDGGAPWTIYDLNGKKVEKLSTEAGGTGALLKGNSDFPNGLYLGKQKNGPARVLHKL